MKHLSIVVFKMLLVLNIVDSLIISTYNIWNVMFNWDVRMSRIKELIKSSNVDIVAFQEVRGGMYPIKQNQLQELQSLLPASYKWNIFKVANNVSTKKDSIHTQYISEGVGLISKLPIIESSVMYMLPQPRNPDTNKRVVLHAVIEDLSGEHVNVIVVHLSYYRQQQCRNVAEILRYIYTKGLKNVILLGDFNTYNDYDWPIRLLLDGRVDLDNPCRRVPEVRNLDVSLLQQYKDVWQAYNPREPGLTFSNMPSPGLESRPDRIISSPNFTVKSVQLDGNGVRYKQRYNASIHWLRLVTIIQSSYLSYTGVSGYPCIHDCGPHGSCQCGVCAAGGNDHPCYLPACHICDANIIKQLQIHLTLAVIIICHLFYAVVAILTVGASTYGETVYTILGCNCCLMNPQLFMRGFKQRHRRNRLIRMLQLWPVFRLPPYIQLVVTIVCSVIFNISVRTQFEHVLKLTYNVMEEEFYPSDHLMVTANLVIK